MDKLHNIFRNRYKRLCLWQCLLIVDIEKNCLKYKYGDGFITREVSRVSALRNNIKITDPNLPLAIQGTSVADFSIKSALDAYFTD